MKNCSVCNSEALFGFETPVKRAYAWWCEDCGSMHVEDDDKTKPHQLWAVKKSAPWDDTPLPEDAEIEAAFPTRSERHDLYGEAMRLVGARRSKQGLVALVNWLLHRLDKAQKDAGFYAMKDQT
jgi:hypothetical protein